MLPNNLDRRSQRRCGATLPETESILLHFPVTTFRTSTHRPTGYLRRIARRPLTTCTVEILFKTARPIRCRRRLLAPLCQRGLRAFSGPQPRSCGCWMWPPASPGVPAPAARRLLVFSWWAWISPPPTCAKAKPLACPQLPMNCPTGAGQMPNRPCPFADGSFQASELHFSCCTSCPDEGPPEREDECLPLLETGGQPGAGRFPVQMADSPDFMPGEWRTYRGGCSTSPTTAITSVIGSRGGLEQARLRGPFAPKPNFMTRVLESETSRPPDRQRPRDFSDRVSHQASSMTAAAPTQGFQNRPAPAAPNALRSG